MDLLGEIVDGLAERVFWATATLLDRANTYSSASPSVGKVARR